MKASVVIPTHNRPEKLSQLLNCLRNQDVPADGYEVIVVDDNSLPPVTLEKTEGGPETSLIRLDETERSAARNRGAAAARGEILLFVDDDMKVGKDFISNHLRAHERYPGALVVGSVRLPEEAIATPFGRFRQRLEDNALPEASGPTTIENFCTAANMSIARERFKELGGFDGSIISSEDQDFALRHSARGGQIVFAPEARAIHCDHALDIRSYCRRAEWGSRMMIPFCLRYPDRADNIERHRINAPASFGREPLSQSIRKIIKSVLASKPALLIFFTAAAFLERAAPDSRALDRIYRLLLGAHILRGYRIGLKRTAVSIQPSIEDHQLAASNRQPAVKAES
ncbi:MAG TPA: glycosyltransferase family 2 protein [Blastocatellia bacterium]|nr:glycosyltransferase family 2 protein [Blastocatellia bacterium]